MYLVDGRKSLLKYTTSWKCHSKDLQFIDSGGQGAVYRAEHQGRIVAVKKVKDPKEIEIKHLLKLKHENIVEFRYVVFAMY